MVFEEQPLASPGAAFYLLIVSDKAVSKTGSDTPGLLNFRMLFLENSDFVIKESQQDARS